VYEFKGDPYHGGDLPVRYANLAGYKELPFYTLRNIHQSFVCPLNYVYYVVFYPLEPGEYVPIVFIPGLYGIASPDMYSDTLQHLASHGYIVIAIDTVVPSLNVDSLHKDEILAKRVYEEVIWVSNSRLYF